MKKEQNDELESGTKRGWDALTPEQKTELQSEIEAKRAEWEALKPEDRMERIRREQEDSIQRQADAEQRRELAERATQSKLDEILDGFKKMAEGAAVMTAEQEREANFKLRVVPQMRSLGWPDRHIKRIAPKWNCREQEQAFKLVRALLQNKGAIIPLVGARGTGKTTIAGQISLLRCIENLDWWFKDPLDRFGEEPPEPARYAKLGELSALLKPLYADFGSVNAGKLAGMLDAWAAAPMVVLDEIHEADDLKTQMRLLVDLLDRRYAAEKDTIIISNHKPEQFSEGVNPSIISRIDEHAKIIPCMWKSHRSSK